MAEPERANNEQIHNWWYMSNLFIVFEGNNGFS